MSTITLVVPITPVAKARPRVVRDYQGRVHTFTPKKTKDFEARIKAAYLEKREEKGISKHPVALWCQFCFEPPKSWGKRKKEQAVDKLIQKTSKPDIDNLLKAVMDALNGLAWVDDAQVVQIYAKKIYSQIPRVEVKIEEVGGKESE